MFSSAQTRDEDGAILVEYGLIIMFIAIATIAMMVLFGASVLDLFTDNTAKMSQAIEISKAN